jgi:hypothetical protein
MILTGEKLRTRKKNSLSAIVSTKNSTCAKQRTNPGLCGERSATNYLSHACGLHVIKSEGRHKDLCRNNLEQGFSDCGTRTTSGTPATVQ